MYRKSFTAIMVLMVLAGVLFGCGSSDNGGVQSEKAANQEESASMDAAPAEAPAEAPAGYSSEAENQAKPTGVERKIIKQAEVSQKVTELEPALDMVQQLVDRSGGFIQASSVTQISDTLREAHYVLRIPQESYTSIIDELLKIGKNINIFQKGDDVTQEYYDNEARIKNLTLQEEAVQRLLEKAEEMEDILRIQQELFRIRGEIEQLQGKNRYIDNLSSLSTIELTIQEVKAVEYVEDSPWAQAKQGFLASLTGVGEFFIQLGVFLISHLPVIFLVYLPVGLIVWWIIRKKKIRSWIKNKKEEKN